MRIGQIVQAPHGAIFTVIAIGKQVRIRAEDGTPMWADPAMLAKWKVLR